MRPSQTTSRSGKGNFAALQITPDRIDDTLHLIGVRSAGCTTLFTLNLTTAHIAASP